MCKAFQRGRWTWLVAGAIGLVPAVQAQPTIPVAVPRAQQRLDETLRQGAAKVLRETFGERAGDLQVRVESCGRVMVLGWVRSEAERVAVAEQLRRLDGCTSIDNQLRVLPSAPMVGCVAAAVQQEPRPLPPSLLEESVPSFAANAPVRRSDGRPVVPVSANTAPLTSTPKKPVEPPAIYSGPAARDLSRAHLPQVRVIAPAAPRPATTTHGDPLPQIVSTPLQLPEVQSGVGWPLRSTLVLPDAGPRGPGTAAPVRWYSPAGTQDVEPILASLSKPAPTQPRGTTVTAIAKPAPPVRPAEVLSIPVPVKSRPVGETTGVMTFIDDPPRSSGAR